MNNKENINKDATTNNNIKEEVSNKIKKKNFMIVSNIDHLSIDQIEKVLEEHSNQIKDYAYVLHDKDTYSKEDELKDPLKKEGELKPPHFHIILRLKIPYTFKSISNWFNVPVNFIETIRNYNSSLRYLTHKDDTNKYQYPNSDVIANFNYSDLIDKCSDKEKLNQILEKINSGEIKEYNKESMIDIKIYSKYKTQINNAIEHHINLISKDKNRNIQIIFVSGRSGCGKSNFAKCYSEMLNKSYCISSSNNDPLQDYKMEDILILDDLRDSSFEFNDLLKILDPYTSSSIKSRYRNKVFTGDTIIITSYKDLEKWYHNIKEMDENAIIQLYRRCSLYFKVFENVINAYYFDLNKKEYVFQYSFENKWNLSHVNKDKNKQQLNQIVTALGVETNDIEYIPKGDNIINIDSLFDKKVRQ